MKGRLFFVCAVMAGLTLSASVEAKDFTSTGQLQVPFIRSIGEATVGEATLRFHAQTTALMDFGSDTALMFGYFGPRLDTKFVNLYLLGGTYLSPLGGMSALVSFWVETPSLFAGKLYALAEFDAYFPVSTVGEGKHTDQTYYVWGAVNWRVSDRTQIGVLTEQLFNKQEHFEAAVGPALSIDNITFWPGWDFTPADDKLDTFLFRVIYIP